MWDVIVVGAGPAGSSAARVAAEAGASVLLLDRARFPRYKTCGGGITGFSLRAMPDAARSTFEAEITDFGLSRAGRDRVMLHGEDPFLGMVQRETFDQQLVDAAVASGAVFRDGTAVRGLAEDDLSVSVRLEGEELRARVVVGADGSNGRTSGYVGVEFARSDLGLEVELDAPGHDSAHHYDGSTALFDWGADPGAYAWLFPKRDTLTIGVIQRTGLPDATRAYLELWLRQLGLEGATRVRESGHLTRWRSRRSPLRRGSVLVAGEAAGLLEPWTREGISFALRSGVMAGAAAASAARAADALSRNAALDGYLAAVERELVPQIHSGAAMLRVLERAPALLHRVLAHTALGRRTFLALCRGSERVGALVDNPVIRAGAAMLSPRRSERAGRPARAPRGAARAS